MINHKEKLLNGNQQFMQNVDYSMQRLETLKNGQNPYAVVITCADSRVSPEIIFSADIGDLFVIRTAGITVGDFELGSLEFAISVLKVGIVIVLGHTACGAVAAAMSEQQQPGKLQTLTCEIMQRIVGAKTATEAEIMNTHEACKVISTNPIIKKYIDSGQVQITPALYDMATGMVKIMD